MATGRLPDPNSSPLTAKGDLYTYSTVPAKLAVGSDGETLVADSSASTGLRYNPQVSAGKNFIINGGMDIWQRGSSSYTLTTTPSYGNVDRFALSQDTTAAGTATQVTSSLPDGFRYGLKIQRNNGATSTGLMRLSWALETNDSIPLAGKTVTISFWAKAGANYSSASSALTLSLYYGTGTDQSIAQMANGSWTGFTAAINQNAVTLTTSWQRFSLSTTLPNTATQVGGLFFYTPVGTAGADDSYSITGIQLEVGSVATAFRRAGGTLAGELAACQRYYYRQLSAQNYTRYAGTGIYSSTTLGYIPIALPVSMRTYPSSVDYGFLTTYDGSNLYAVTNLTISTDQIGNTSAQVAVTLASGGTANRPFHLLNDANTGGYLGFNAEL